MSARNNDWLDIIPPPSSPDDNDYDTRIGGRESADVAASSAGPFGQDAASRATGEARGDPFNRNARTETATSAVAIRPSAFRWRKPSTIPPREWIYGHHLIRKYVAATIAPGGVGKSTLTTVDAVAMVTGKALLGLNPHGRLRVWLWNGEDPRDEIERRVAAVMLHHAIDPRDVEGRLWIDSGRDTPIKISDDAQKIAMPVIDALVAAILDRHIDVLIVDPFVSVHGLPENDNRAMDAAVKAFALVADRTGCAIDLLHHSRKLNGADADIDAARGGSAIAGAVRSARALNVMSAEAAKAFGIDERERRSHVRIDDAKANLAPASAARWFKLTAEPLGNFTADRIEDHVAVAEPWSPPDMLEGITLAGLIAVQKAVHNRAFRESPQANEWAGHAVGRALGLNSYADPDKQKIKNALKAWTKSGALIVERVQDDKGHQRPVIQVGEWASSPP